MAKSGSLAHLCRRSVGEDVTQGYSSEEAREEVEGRWKGICWGGGCVEGGRFKRSRSSMGTGGASWPRKQREGLQDALKRAGLEEAQKTGCIR